MDLSLFEDKDSEEFDVQVYGGPDSGLPLTITRRRDRKREVVVIDWKVEDWEEWENPIVFGRRYTNALPLRIADDDKEDDARNPFEPIIPGSAQRTGTTAELELPTGHTAHFAFWLKGVNWPRPKGILPSKPKPWSTRKRPIRFSVLMRRPDSLGRLREIKDEESYKNEIIKIVREREKLLAPRVEEPKKDRVKEEFEHAMKQAESLEEILGLMNTAAEKEQSKLNAIDERLERKEIDQATAEFLRAQTKQAYTNIIEMLAAQMPGTPRV